MKVNFTLNGEAVLVETVPTERLATILRNKFGLCQTKLRCGEGSCGACTVLLDGEPVHSCITPVYAVKGCKVVTLEHFKATPEGKDIALAFEKAGLDTCGFCNAEKFFMINEYIGKNPTITDMQDAYHVFESTSCKCVKRDTFIGAIIYAARNRKERLDRTKNGK